MLRLFKIETKKYRGLPVFRLLLVAVAMSLIFSCIQIFDAKSAADLAKITKLYAVFDNAAVVKIIVQPIILASLASIAVQVENRHKMWKVLTSSGVDYKSIYAVKFFYIYSAYLVMQVLEWLLTLALVKWRGYTVSLPIGRLVLYGLSILGISAVIMLIHYLLSLSFANQLISLSVAVLASLVSIILIFISKAVMYVVPYSWYALLMATEPERVGDTFVYHVTAFNYFPLIASLIVTLVLYQLGKRVKIGD
ncbi:ABC transporter permease [uncultured Streptococcus sp.]|uniref:ABC transporter permease n=1 Tax=uncultured Streptococcus sp. TaxID=83427 RepID=UPI0027DB6E09|nr:ABC transporter permease [uncultured Streptococcus sp.]